MKPKIFIWSVPLFFNNDVHGYALSEDGVLLASHHSSNEAWNKIDMTNEIKVKIYEKHYPNGYEIEFVKEGDYNVRKDFAKAVDILTE
jgi:hypothetical protein